MLNNVNGKVIDKLLKSGVIEKINNKKEFNKMSTIKNIVKVENFQGVKNQFIITTNEGRYFQSYNSIIAFKCNGKVYLDAANWDYSNTTGKYRNMFLHETKKETESKIKSGEYILTDLNK